MSIEIPLAMQGLELDEIELVCRVFQSGNHTMGASVHEFELAFSKFLGVRNAVMVNSGSSANLLALESVVRGRSLSKIKSGSLVALPAILWPTSLWPIIQLGFRVLLIDTKPNSLEIDFDQLIEAKNKFGEQLAGVVLIHPLGKALSMEKVLELREKYGMFVLEDNCESLGAGNNGVFAGTIGNFGSFSFYFSHHITTVEGGMVITNDDEAADDLRSMRAHGWSRNRLDRLKWDKNAPQTNANFNFITSGYNFRPMEFQGALGISQLKKLPGFLEKRRLIAERAKIATYSSSVKLLGSENLLINDMNLKSKMLENSWMALPFQIVESGLKLNVVHKFLNSKGIHTRPLLAGNFIESPAGDHPEILSYGELEQSRKIYNTSFMVGNHHGYSEEQVVHLANSLAKI